MTTCEAVRGLRDVCRATYKWRLATIGEAAACVVREVVARYQPVDELSVGVYVDVILTVVCGQSIAYRLIYACYTLGAHRKVR